MISRQRAFIAFIAFSIVLAALVVPSASAQDEAVAPDAGSVDESVRLAPRRLTEYGIEGLDSKINFSSTPSMTKAQIILTLAHYGRIKNVVLSPGVQGPTAQVSFDGVSVGEALETVMAVNDLAFEVKGDIITVMTNPEYKNKYGISFDDRRDVKIVELKYADPARVSTMLAAVKSDRGSVVGDPVTGNLILVDTPAKLKEMEAVIKKADIATISRVLPTVTESFVLQYADIDEIQGELTSILTKEAGSLQANTRTKTLIVTDLPHNMQKIRNLISLFDAKPRQVFIEAKIVEVSLNDQFSLGINWKHMFQSLDPRFSLESVSAPGSLATPVGTLKYNTIVSDGDLQMVLTALKEIGDTRVISNPQIAVADGKEASIKVVEKQPIRIIGLESGTTNITEVSFDYVDVGVQLSVTPRINPDGFINVDIKPEISTISGWYAGAPQEGTPVVKTANAQTTVLVKDGVTIIIGGLIKDREDKTTSSVPFLGRIPILGRLFRYESTSVVNTETVVFLTPRIVTGEESFLRMKDVKKPLKPLRTTVGKPMKPIR